ncbi:cytochrome P450 [Aspergillus ruber CBS 135680]|uniref:Putative cytochrome P450 monooxygenase n=1 Tax=Aspergillus ruber (strain CBS 135680) TaxID=1388766 RepID=A0A017SDZ7_ASPRC|nr:putative cytochrome P450 monooxygenase [Aspergillus ruber CBS 135680]EYE95238.1 putative cytochrome P450 monooxygenase [Aspergillus ruber CBS 135680]
MLFGLTLKLVPALYAVYLFVSTIWYIYLHPLRRIPGPKSWIIFPILRQISGIRGRFDSDICRFHRTYGPAVRYGRDEVSFITPDAWKEIYGHGHAQLPKVLTSASNTSDIVSSNDADHSRHRKALSHAFSAKGLQAQEPLVNGYVDKLIERLKGMAETGVPVDMVKWYNLTTFDIIGDLAFGEPFGGLEKAEYHHWVAMVFGFVKVISFVRLGDSYPVAFSLLKAFLLPKGLMAARQRQLDHAKSTVAKRLQNADRYHRGDFMDSMLRHAGEKDGLSVEELEGNANILIIAGSETTATLLSGATYWLLRTPDVMKKVTDEVRSVMLSEAEITSSNIAARLPYMLACLEEALRMYPPVPTGLQRRTLTPVRISGYDVAPGVCSPRPRENKC